MLLACCSFLVYPVCDCGEAGEDTVVSEVRELCLVSGHMLARHYAQSHR